MHSAFSFWLYHFASLSTNPCPFCTPHPTEKYNFLGISIVGQSNERGDGGIYIGSIMKGGAVAADGRIEPGDMLLQVWSHCIQAQLILKEKPVECCSRWDFVWLKAKIDNNNNNLNE